MTFDPALSAMMAEPWSNGACRGYVIMAMENCGFSTIRHRTGWPPVPPGRPLICEGTPL